MYNKILFPADGSPQSDEALPHLKELALKFKSEVVLVNVCEPVGDTESRFGAGFNYAHELEEHRREKSNIILNEIEQKLKEAGITVKTCSVSGDCGPAIIETAGSEKCDLIVMPRRGLGPVKSLLLGSVSNYVVHHCSCPVLLIG